MRSRPPAATMPGLCIGLAACLAASPVWADLDISILVQQQLSREAGASSQQPTRQQPAASRNAPAAPSGVQTNTSKSPTTGDGPTDPEAQYQLAVSMDAESANPDLVQAARWYRAAAEQGHAVSQANLGLMYAQGQGLARDDRQAVRWLTRAGQQGHTIAQYSLGLMHYEGRGVRKSFQRALGWYQRAAKGGSAKAMNNIGIMNALGEGLRRDEVSAYAWFAAAAASGDSGGENNRRLIAEEFNPATLKQAEARALELQAELGL